MLKDFGKKLLETFLSILPLIVVSTILFLLNLIPNLFVTYDNKHIISTTYFLLFLGCSVTLILGSTIFQLGADNALNKVGQYIGSHITKKQSLVFLSLIAFVLGLLITIAEPDLTLLGDQLSASINPWVVKLVVGAGVGIFITIAAIRIITQKSIKVMMLTSYFIVFCIGVLFGPVGDKGSFIALAFDSSGVTTGPATVPFVVSFGISVASTRGGKDTSKDSFGVTGIMSIGPVLSMLILSLILKQNDSFKLYSAPTDFTDLGLYISNTLSENLLEVFLGITPIIAIFYVYNFIFLKLPKKELLSIFLGYLFSFIGLYLFISSAKIGFIPFGNELGKNIAGNESIHFLLVLIALILGSLICFAEPSVVILTEQVEEVSNGSIKRKSIYLALSIAVSLAITLEVSRVLYWNSFPIEYFIVPIFIVIVLLMPLVSDIFIGIAFDSGGVASGVLASSFILPMMIGITSVLNPESENAAGISLNTNYNSGFGVVGLICLMPIISIEILGANDKLKYYVLQKIARKKVFEDEDAQILHF